MSLVLDVESNRAEVKHESRRRFLQATLGAALGGMAAAIAAVLGKAAIGRGMPLRTLRWVRAGRLDALETDIPTPVTLRVTREDGYLETMDQHVVFLVRSESGTIRALSSTCAHLGCNVMFERDKQQFLCPCHNGVFNLDGSVAAGPPPKGLDELVTRVEGTRVFVRV